MRFLTETLAYLFFYNLLLNIFILLRYIKPIMTHKHYMQTGPIANDIKVVTNPIDSN